MNFCHYVPSFVRSGPIHGNPSSHDSPSTFSPPPPYSRGRKSERKNLIMISFRSNEALVLWGPARLPSSWVSGTGWGGGRAVRAYKGRGLTNRVLCVSHVLPTACCCCCCCCAVLQLALQKTNNLTLSPFPSAALPPSPAAAALPLLSHRYPSLCPVRSVPLSSHWRLLPVRCRGQRIRR